MTYRDVTLAPDDIEWVDPSRERCGYLQPLVFNWDAFNTHVEQVGVLVALEQFTEFHRHVANQLIGRAVKDPSSSGWAARTISLCHALKLRRGVLRARAIEVLGEGDALVLFDVLKSRWPRAVWGSSPYARNEN
jgi:hypothetical protein